MALLKEYDKITVLCGGNFNRRDLVDFEIANAMDDDFKDVMKHRKRWIHKHRCRKSLFVVDIVIGFFSLFALFVTLIPVLSDRVAEIAGLQPFASNSTVIWICAIGCGFALLYPIAANKFKKRDDSRYSRLKRVWDNNSSDNDRSEAKMKAYMRFIERKFPQSAEAYWLPIEGHVSDAQIVPFLTAKTGRNIELAFAGMPYFREYFADSLCFKVISGTSSMRDETRPDIRNICKQQTKAVQEVLAKAKDEHIIRYFLALGDEYTDEKDKTKIEQYHQMKKIKNERSNYVFGVSFLSWFLHELFFTYNPKSTKNPEAFMSSVHRPIGICFDPKYQDQNNSHIVQDLKAIRFLLKVAAQPPFVRIFDEEVNVKYDQFTRDVHEDCCVYLMVTDIIPLLPTDKKLRESLNEITEYRRRRYLANKDCIRIPVKRLFVLPNENNPACPFSEKNMNRFPITESNVNKSLIMMMGGAEQNYSIQMLVSMQSWQDPTLRYQFSENYFSRSSVNFFLLNCTP